MDDPRANSRFIVNRRRLFAGAGISAAGAVGMLGRGAFGQSTPVPAATTAVATPVDEGARPGFQPIEVVLWTDLDSITDEQLWYVASIINAQVTLDFGPIWGVNAWVTAARKKTPIPVNAWEIGIYDSITVDPDNGIEKSGHAWKDPNDCTVRPYGFVVYGEFQNLAHSVSHECLEMLANPYQSTFHLLPTVDRDKSGDVLYPQEICDPCQTAADGYTIDGQVVSDFVTPRYYDRTKDDGSIVTDGNFSFRGKLSAPLSMTTGSMLNWLDRDLTTWWTATQTAKNVKPSVEKMQIEAQTNCLP